MGLASRADDPVTYLLDANTLIDANRDYYPMSRVPEFWAWLENEGHNGRVKLPVEIWEEVSEGDDDLSRWLKRPEVKEALLLEEDSERGRVALVVEQGYARNLDDEEIEKLGCDPFLIAHALRQPTLRVVVSTERSAPAKIRANRKVPDVCRQFGVRCIDTFQLVRELDFSTGWRSSGQ